MSPTAKFWQVTVAVFTEDEKGKIKTSKELHLVDASDLQEVEKKVKEMMESESRDWEIRGTAVSNICEVY